jgi:Holliday junction resolvase
MIKTEYIYLAQFNDCIYESSYATLSIHKTRKGAKLALEKHKLKEQKAFIKVFGKEKALSYRDDKSWVIIKMKLKD